MIRLEHAKKTYSGFQLDCSMEIRASFPRRREFQGVP